MACALLIPLATALGCAKEQDPRALPVFPAVGTITFNGQPPVGAALALHPKDAGLAKDPKFIPPRASVRPDGTFALTSYRGNDGAPPGEYIVTIEWHKTIKTSSGEPNLGPNLLPPVYSKVKTSPVIVKIAEGKNELPPIVLK